MSSDTSEITKQKTRQELILSRIFFNPMQNKNIEKHNRTVEKNKIEKDHRNEIFAILNAQKNSSQEKLLSLKILGQLNDIDNISKFHDSYFRLASHLEKNIEIQSPVKWDSSITKDQLKTQLQRFKDNSSRTDFFSFKHYQQRFDSFWKTNKLSGDSLFRKLENIKDDDEEINNFTHLKPIDQLQLKLKKEFEQEYILKPKRQNLELILQTQLQAPKLKGEKKPILLIRKLKFLKKFWEEKQKENQKDKLNEEALISPFRSATNSISKTSAKVSVHKSNNNSSSKLKEILKMNNSCNKEKKYLISHRLQEIISQNKNTSENDHFKKHLLQMY